MVAIQPATSADIDQLVAIEQELFQADRISRRQFRYLLTRANSIAVKIVDDSGEIMGYLILLLRRNSDKVRIYSIGISGKAQHRGYAGELLRYAEQVARKKQLAAITLEVCEHNSSAIRLYQRFGYQQTGTKPEYYEDGCNTILFSTPIG